MKILFIQTAPPHGSLRGQEGLDALLMGSAFADCAALFMGDSVLQLVGDQVPEKNARRNFAKTFGALRDYGVTRIYCDESALTRFGIRTEDLVIPAEAASPSTVQALLAEHDQVVSF